MREGRSARWLVVGTAPAAVVWLLLPAVAWAHASGELPRAELRAGGTQVHVTYVAPADDAAVIGMTLGYLREGAMAALLGEGSADLPTPEEIAALSSSPALRDYLEDHVVVSQHGIACRSRAAPADDFLADGAEIDFTCPEPVERAEVRITVLHDEDPAYRTFSVDGSVQYAIHSAAAPEHTWDFTMAASGDGGIDPLLAVAAAAVVVVLVALVVVTGPRRRRPGP